METTEPLPEVIHAPLVLGRYRLGERLGAGGFGTVYAAQDERLRRPVAVKVIPGVNGDPADPQGRGRREALAAARLDHPGVVAVYDAGEDARARYLVSELVHGETLDRLSADGVLSDRDVLRIGLALCGALAHAHERGVVHRDVKPQNVIVPEAPRSAAGVAKLADFGIAHLAGDDPLTLTGDVVGTLAYMAPEQAAGERVDERADLYSLALVVYEALAGVNPVRAGSPAATARRVGTVLPPLAKHRADLPEELTEAIDAALLPDPDERGDLSDLAYALKDALPHVSDAGGTVAPHPAERGAIPWWAPRAGAAALAGGLAGAAIPFAAAGGEGAAARAGHAGAAASDAATHVATAVAAGIPPLAAAAVVFVAVALLPRVAWLAAAIAVIAIVAHDRPGPAAGLLAAALIPIPLLLRRNGTAWSVPALAPLLGLAGLAGAYPALAGQARRWYERAALGALGAWAALVAQPLLARTLLSVPDKPGGRDAATIAGDLVTGGGLLYAAVFAVAAVPLPWIVRGRSLATDVVLGAAWAAALAAAASAAAQALNTAQPRAIAVGAALAGTLALVIRWSVGARLGTVHPQDGHSAG
jgi:hypothetical protein